MNDMWAIGVIAYILVCQEPPFIYGGDNNLVGREAIKDYQEQMTNFNDYDENENYSNEGMPRVWKLLNNKCKDEDIKIFITSLLKKNPEDRLDAALALKQDWITKTD